ncbi:MAG: pyridoxal phosphate-dependent aminotransferase [Vicinamibacterales bacterium]
MDLTLTNPTAAGFTYPHALLAALGDESALRYTPDPRGLLVARASVAAAYGARGIAVDPDSVLLTASTSEAYSFIFKLLCDPGDEVLVPVPSYPLFEHLASLDGVTLKTYPLEYHGVWSMDVEQLVAETTERTRAVIVVAPNNPTGSLLRRAQWEQLASFCAARDVAVIADEVFLDYLLEPAEDGVRGVVDGRQGAGGPLLFSLGGLSKSIGLPQHKLGWMIVQGPEDKATVALERLQWIGDTYLSVATPVQVAAPRLLEEGAAVRTQIRVRLGANLATLKARLVDSPSCEVLRVEGGWSAVIRVPAIRSEEDLACSLIEEHGVLVHPGYFYDFSRSAHLVVSLLASPDVFEQGVDRLCRSVET